MGDKTGIEWSDATWNCLYGCSRVSPGCEHCYAEREIHRFAGDGQRYDGLTVLRKKGPAWTGKIQLAYHRIIEPLKWQRPRRIFVNSLSDVFHENVPFGYVMAMYGIMAACPHHTFQLLTKREGRMALFYDFMKRNHDDPVYACVSAARDVLHSLLADGKITTGTLNRFEEELEVAKRRTWPLSNVWLGVSAENNEMLLRRVPKLFECEAAVRWISAEPLLGPLDGIEQFLSGQSTAGLDWVVVGGESGRGARVMNPRWVDFIGEACAKRDVPWLFKQWGEYMPHDDRIVFDGEVVTLPHAAEYGATTTIRHGGIVCEFASDGTGGWMKKVGKKKSGRLLYGRTHDGYPGERVA